MMNRDTFIVYRNMDIDGLSDEQLGQLFRAMLAYANNEEVQVTDPEVRGMWRNTKLMMDRNETKYKDRCIQNSIAANKRWHSETATEEKKPEQTVEPTPPPKKPKPIKRQYGNFHHVRLTDDELDRLIKKYGKEDLQQAIQNVDDYCEQSGKTYKNYSLVIQKWGMDFKKRGNVKGGFSADEFLDSVIRGDSNDGTGSW